MALYKFASSLDLLLGFNVNLYVGEEVYKGKLIGVETDHIILENENNYIFYYSIEQIQAITKNTKEFQGEELPSDFLKTHSLTEVLNSFKHSWVTILCLNKQKFNGILSQVDEDFATLINGEERILIKLTHISNILKGFINQEETKTDSTEASSQSNSKNDNDTKDKSESTSEKSNHKIEYNSDTSSNDDNSTSEKKAISSTHKEKSEKQQEAAAKTDVVEPNNTMVWSQPIKIEAPIRQIQEKSKTEMKKQDKDRDHNETKTEEAKLSKTKTNDSSKEVKQVKESVPIVKIDKKNVTLTKMDIQPPKLQETVNVNKQTSTQSQSSKKTENTKNEVILNNNTNIGKPKEQETRTIRFSGEPVSRDNQRSFPFSGWPNRNNRATRF